MSMTAPLLAATDLVLWRGETPVLDGVSLALGRGELLRVEGENGSGKTTLLRVLAGLVEPDEGQVRFNGEALPGAQDALSAAMLYLGHRPGTSEALSAVENLQASAAVHDHTPDIDRIVHTLAQLGLGDRHDLPVASLSAGQRRRVALARLALEPRELWILDEPLTALDSQGLDWVRAQLARHVSSGGSALLTTHQPLEVPDVRERRLRLCAGREQPSTEARRAPGGSGAEQV